MNFYRVQLGDQNNREWRAILRKEEDEKHGIISTLNAGNKLQFNNPFNMELVNIYPKEDRKDDKPFDLDLIYWTDDLMLDAFKPKGVTCIIVSRKFMELLREYNCHNHTFYPVHLYSPDKSVFQEYFLLQIFDKWLQFVNYKDSEYTLKEIRTRGTIDQIRGSHEFDDFESYVKRKSDYLRNESLLLDFYKAIMTVDYDILWGTMNELTVNKLIKENIEISGLRGIKFTPIKSPEYILKSEFEGWA